MGLEQPMNKADKRAVQSEVKNFFTI